MIINYCYNNTYDYFLYIMIISDEMIINILLMTHHPVLTIISCIHYQDDDDSYILLSYMDILY
jgi:hypothetical protein